VKVWKRKMPTDKTRKFDFILLEAIDEALTTLGESIKKSVYFHLEVTYKMKRPEIPNEIERFSDSLDKMFGAGARFIEILIIKRFYPKIQVTCEWQGPEFILPNLTFKEYVELVKKEYCKSKIKGTVEFFIDETNQEYVSETIPNNL
jgi:hypothetical protein